MKTPTLNQLPFHTHLLLLGAIVLLVGVFFSVNSAMNQQQTQSNAAVMPSIAPSLPITPTVLPTSVYGR